MTSETDLREVSAQIEIVKQLIDNPETLDIHKILIELEAKKKLLMKYKPRDYITILKEFCPEEVPKIEEPKVEEPKVDTEKISEIKRLKAKIKTLQETKLEEIPEE